MVMNRTHRLALHVAYELATCGCSHCLKVYKEAIEKCARSEAGQATRAAVGVARNSSQGGTQEGDFLTENE